MTQTVTQEEVFEALKTVYDPEIPVNVVDLGLIYEVQVNDENNVYVQLTLTFPGCGMGPHIAQQAEWAVQDVEGVEEVEIELVFANEVIIIIEKNIINKNVCYVFIADHI